MTMLASPPVRTHASKTAAKGSGVDVTSAARRFRRMAAVLPRTTLLYDVATRGDEALLVSLARAGAGFAVEDVAAAAGCADHAQACAGLGGLVSTARVESCDDVAAMAAAGVRTFVVRSPEETCRVAIAAPTSAVLVRVVPLSSTEDGAEGCTVPEAVTVLRQAAASGLDATGVSFEIASLRRSPRAIAAAVGASARLFGAAAEAGVQLDTIDLGGGLPAVEDGAPPLASYAATLDRSLLQEFGLARPRMLLRVGRAVVGAAAA
jgi:ornithine decarboxylase